MYQAPLTQYKQLVLSGGFEPDVDQLTAVQAIDQLWHELQQEGQSSLLSKLRKRNPTTVRGLYLWGSVGRGKTWLMDLFFEQLPIKQKQRIHFHRFMQRIHASLREQGNVQDPLPRIAESWAKECRVLCLDEFFVSDIADAMLLAGLLERLFALGVTLVTTSNINRMACISTACSGQSSCRQSN